MERVLGGGETRNRTVDTRIFSPVRALLEDLEFLSKQGYIRRLSEFVSPFMSELSSC